MLPARRRRHRALLALAAAALGAALLCLPPRMLAVQDPFVHHMLRHMMLVALISPLLVIGLGAFLRLPRPAVAIATLAEFVVVWGWHLPLLHEAAGAHVAVLLLEQASFLIVGLWLWTAVLAPGAALPAIGALLLTSMHMTLLGALLVLAPQLLYDPHVAGHGREATLAGQQAGGLVMLAIGTPVYIAAALLRLGSLLRHTDDVAVSPGPLP